MKLVQLARQGREPALPLSVELNGRNLQVQRWLRVLPGQRYVGQALLDGRPVLAKLLVGRRAARQYERERTGARLLAEQGIATPALLAQGWQDGQGGWLLFEFLEGAQSLWDAWREVESERPLSDAQQQVLGQALAAVAALHARGLWQEDLHLDNLMVLDGQVQVVDGGGVRAEAPGTPLSRDQVLDNLGVFFAQLPASLDAHLEELLIHYLLANAEHALPLELLQVRIDRVRRWRLRDYLRKVGRDCSLFAAQRGPFGLQVVRREEQASLAPLLADPDAAIRAGRRIKGGGTATVAVVELDGRKLLVKRYNIKSPLHCLKRFWRPSRAWHSWVEGHRLEFLGLATPRPLAVIEHRWAWLRGRAWLITDYLEGQDIIARFERYPDGEVPDAELDALAELFAGLQAARISHGDLKGYNLFWDAGRWSLIDLDAMHQHRRDGSFRRAHARDRGRLLRNWPDGSTLRRRLEERLPLLPDA